MHPRAPCQGCICVLWTGGVWVPGPTLSFLQLWTESQEGFPKVRLCSQGLRVSQTYHPGPSLPDAGDVAHWGSEWAQGQQGQRGYLGTSPLREETGADEEEVGCPGQRQVCRGGTFFWHLEGPG